MNLQRTLLSEKKPGTKQDVWLHLLNYRKGEALCPEQLSGCHDWDQRWKELTAESTVELFQVMGMLYTLTVMAAAQLYTFFRTQTMHFKLVNF